MRLFPLWVFFAVFFLLSHEDIAHAQTAANPIKIKTPVSDPAPFKPDEAVVLTSATAVRPPAGFFTSPHTLSLSFSWAISGASGPLTTVTTVVHVVPPYEYSPTAGPTSANPILLTTGTLSWDVANTSGGCVPDGKFGTLISVSGVVDEGTPGAVTLPTATRAVTLTCKGDLPVVSDLTPIANSLLSTSSVTVSGQVDAVSGASVVVNGVTATVNGSAFTAVIGLQDGTTNVPIVAQDCGGRVKSTTLRLIVDTVPLTLQMSTPADGAATRNEFTPVTVTLRDPAPGSGTDVTATTLHVDGVDVTSNATRTASSIRYVPSTPFSDGNHQVASTARDKAGNATTLHGSFRVDTVKPVVQLTPPAGSFVLNTQPTFTASWSDAAPSSGISVETLQVLLDGDDVTSAAVVNGSSLSFTPAAPLASGNHSLVVKVRDLAGNVGSASDSFKTDAAPPSVNIVSPVSASASRLSSASVVVQYSGSGPGIAIKANTFQATLDGTNISTAFSKTTTSARAVLAGPLSEGDHVLNVSIADVYGLIGHASSTWTVDTRVPAISVTSPTHGTTLSSLPQIEMTFSDPAPGSGIVASTFEAELDGQAIGNRFTVTSSGATWTLDPSSQPVNGPHLLTARVSDRAGHTAAVSISFAIAGAAPDTVSPVVTLSPVSGTLLATGVVVLSADLSDAAPSSGLNLPGTFHATLDGQDVTASTSLSGTHATLSFSASSPLADGSHQWSARVSDHAGNEGAATSSFQIDSRAPTLVIEAPADGSTVTTTTPSYAASFADPSPGSGLVLNSFKALVDGIDRTAAFLVSPTGATFQTPLSDPLPPGAHSVLMEISDSAGHKSNAQSSFIVVPPVAESTGTLVGEIRTGEPCNSSPLAGATVRILATGNVTTTDAAGKFSLQVPAGLGWLEVSRPGYLSVQRQFEAFAGQEVAFPTQRIAAEDSHHTHIVAADGGTATDSTGKVTLELPPGALPQDMDIVLTLVTSPDQSLGPPMPGAIPGVAARISPEGVTLNAPAKLRIRSPFFTAGHPVLSFDWNPHTQTRERNPARVLEDGFYETTITHFSGADSTLCGSTIVARAGTSSGPAGGPFCGGGGGRSGPCPGGACSGPPGGGSSTGPASGPGGPDGGPAAGSSGPGGPGPQGPMGSGPVFHAASPTVLLKTGHVSEAHALAPINVLNRSRTLRFVYDQSTADPAPVIATDYTIPVTPSALHIRSQIGRYSSDTHYVPRAGATYHAFQWDATDSAGQKVPTGVYPVSLHAHIETTATLANDNTELNWNIETIFPMEGSIAIQNNRQSPFGAGWWLEELDRLIPGPRGSIMWAGGVGQCAVYETGYMTQPIAGAAAPGYSGDGGPAKQATFNNITDLASDGQGGWFVLDLNNHRVRRINAAGVVTTWAGNGTNGIGIDGPATASPLENPIAISASPEGDLYIAELADDQELGPVHRIRKVDSSGTITTVFRDENLFFRGIVDMAHDPTTDSLLILAFEQIFRVVPGSQQPPVRVAGTSPGYAGDSEPARTFAKFLNPSSITADHLGRITIVDAGNFRIRQIDATGVIRTIGGTGVTSGIIIEKTLATNANLDLARGASVAVTPDGDVVFTDPNFGLVRRIRPNGVVQSIGGLPLKAGADILARGAAQSVSFGKPAHIAVAPDGRIAVVPFVDPDFANHIRVLEPSLDGRKQFIAPPGLFVSLTREVDGSYIQTTQQGISHTYNPEGLKTSVRDLNGNETTYSYTSDGRLSTVRESTGQTWTLTYSQGKLTRVQDHTGRATLFEIDTNGDLVSITDPGASTFRYTYDSSHRLSTWSNPVNHGGSVMYSSRGLVERITHQDNSFDTYQPQDAAALVNNLAPGLGVLCNPTQLTLRDEVRAVRIDTRGKAWTYQLDSFGQPLVSKDPLGRTFSYVRRDTGQTAEMTRPNGSKVTYSYSLRDELVKEVDTANTDATHPLSSTKTYAYAPDRVIVTSVVDALGQTTSVTLDSHANIVGTTKPEGVTESNVYDSRGLLIQSIDGRGKTTAYSYDSFGNLERVTHPDLTTHTYTRTPEGYVASITDEENHVTRFTYHPFGLRATREDAAQRTESWSYNAARQVLSHTNRRSKTTSTEYDLRDRPNRIISPTSRISSIAYDPEGHITSITDAKGRTTTLDYDDAGQIIKRTQPGDVVTEYRYTLDLDCSCGAGGLLGKISVIVNPRQGETRFSHDKSGRTTSVTDPLQGQARYTYDVNGNLVREDHPDGWFVSHQFDGQNRPFAMDNPVTSDSQEYDKNGNVVDEIVNSTHRQRVYDDRNRLTTLIEFPGNASVTTRFEYTSSGSLKALVTPNQNRWTFEYDSLHRLTTETDPLGRSATYTYDENGNLLTARDRKGQLTQYTYNDEDERTSITYHDGSSVDLAYDSTGKLTSASDARVSVNRTYDELDRLQTLSIPQLARTLTMQYDKASNRTALGVNGAQTTYTYDALNRLKTLLHPSGAQAAWEYDSVGMVTRKTLPHGIVANLTYDRRRVNSMSYVRPDSSPLAAFVYTYNPDSTINTMLEGDGTTRYEYDAHHRLTRVEYPTGRLRSEDFEYDRSGNRIRHVRTAQDEFSDRLITYDPADQIVSSVEQNLRPAPPCPEGTPPHLCPGGPPPDRTHFSHDLNGNMTSVTDFKFAIVPSGENTVTTTSYTYDVRNRLTEAVLPSGQIERFDYYPNSPLRLSFTTPGVAPNGGTKTLQLWDPNTGNPLQDLDASSATLVEYAMGGRIDEPLARVAGGATHAFIGDRLESVRGLVDSAGTQVNQYSYEAFGAGRSQVEAIANRLRFTSRELDTSTGQQYTRNRQLALSLGRWTQRDPIGFRGGLNLYAYAENNPLRYRDPLGLTVGSNIVFLLDFILIGQSYGRYRYYDANDFQTQEMRESMGGRMLVDWFYAHHGKPPATGFDYTTPLAAKQTLFRPWYWSNTAMQVGGFSGFATVDECNGTVTFKITNNADARSFFYHAPFVPNPPRSYDGLFRTIEQTFEWTEMIDSSRFPQGGKK